MDESGRHSWNTIYEVNDVLHVSAIRASIHGLIYAANNVKNLPSKPWELLEFLLAILWAKGFLWWNRLIGKYRVRLYSLRKSGIWLVIFEPKPCKISQQSSPYFSVSTQLCMERISRALLCWEGQIKRLSTLPMWDVNQNKLVQYEARSRSLWRMGRRCTKPISLSILSTLMELSVLSMLSGS